MIPLPPAFLSIPLAHRALHDVELGRPENALAAIRAAVQAGYGIEIDIQPSADGVAMVFHDYALERLMDETGPISARSAAELAQVSLIGGGHVPRLSEVLALVDGRVPLLIEVKDQDGAMGPDVGPLEAAIARDLAGYTGDVAVMSFNPHSVASFAHHAPDVPRGLTTCAFDSAHWPLVPAARRSQLAEIPDFVAVGASFISHGMRDLSMQRVAELKARDVPVLCWTVRSPREEAEARKVADNITFESYAPPLAPA